MKQEIIRLKHSMKIENLKFKIILVLVLATGYALSATGQVHSQAVNTGIYPPILQIDAEAPASVNSDISIENKSDQNVTYGIYLVPFKASSTKNGQPEYDPELNKLYKNIFDKMQITSSDKVINQIELAPGQKKNLNLHIGIPKGEKAFDYYFSVVFISTPDEQNLNSSFSGAKGGIGTNVLLSIGPKGKPQGNLKMFEVPSFTTKGPINFKVLLENTGSNYFTPEGNIIVKNMFGQTIGAVETVPVNVLSDSERYIPSKGNVNKEVPTVTWNEKFLLGFYTAELNIKLSDEGPVFKKEVHFFAFPVEGILGIIIASAIVFGIIKRVKAKKAKDQY